VLVDDPRIAVREHAASLAIAGIQKSSASRNATQSPLAIASPTLRAAEGPWLGWRSKRTCAPKRASAAAGSSREPSSTQMISCAGTVCASTLSTARPSVAALL
jgi:hypothetical protein